MKVRRSNKKIIIISILLIILIINLINNSRLKISTKKIEYYNEGKDNINKQQQDNNNDNDIPFMPKMGNETIKAELGRSTWRLLHTILSRYPKEPNFKERKYLKQFIESFAQVYPCGDCARHFIKLITKYPPQINSRKNAAMWGCFIHNQVNLRLGKEEYDCSTILEDYDCGCGVDEEGDEEVEVNEQIKEGEVDNQDSQIHLNSIVVESVEDNISG